MKKIIISGLILLIASSVLFRGLYFPYETYGVMAGVVLLSLFYFFTKIRNNEDLHFHKLFTALSILLIAAYAFAYASAVNPRANTSSLLLYVELAIIFHVLYDYFYDKDFPLIQWIMWSTIIIGAVAAIIGLEALTYSFKALEITIFDKRLGSTFAYRNTAAIYFSICIMFVLTLISLSKHSVLKCILAGTGNLFMLALFMTGSRGGWLVGSGLMLILFLIQPSVMSKYKNLFGLVSMVIPITYTYGQYARYAAAHDYVHASFWIVVSIFLSAILYILFLLLEKFLDKYVVKGKTLIMPRGTGVISLVIFVAAVFCAFVFREQLFAILPSALGERFKGMNMGDSSILLRLENDSDALKLIAGNWITGLGGGGWQTRNQSVQEVYYSITLTHNNYLQVFVESGILGFLSYTTLIIASFILLVKKFIQTQDLAHKVAISGVLCSLAALAVHSAFDFDLTYISLDLLLWVMFVISAGKQHNKNAGRMTWSTYKQFAKGIPTVLCGALLSLNLLYFTAAYNAQQAIKYARLEQYQSVVRFYEEAVRLDPSNSEYTSELARTYYFMADRTGNTKKQKEWLDKAISAGEQSVNSNQYFPAYVRGLIRIYMSAGNTEKILEYSQLLISNEPYYGNNYEVLSRAYLNAADYYISQNDEKKAKQFLAECVSIEKNPILIKILERKPSSVTGWIPRLEAQPGKNLQKNIDEARKRLEEMS
jgi:tetratricopeptide (TPR) repeat protein